MVMEVRMAKVKALVPDGGLLAAQGGRQKGKQEKLCIHMSEEGKPSPSNPFNNGINAFTRVDPP